MSLSSFQLGLILLGLLALSGTDAVKKRRHQVLMMSFDGFRWDYVDKYNMSNFTEFRKEGVHARTGIVSSFVTMTFPDHYTIATGLHEENHGIVGDSMYDPVFHETFSPRNTEPKWWDGGEPIWITSKLQGLKSASYYWPGADVKLKNVATTFVSPYDPNVPYKERVDTVVKWLEEKTDVILAYFEEPGHSGQKYGALSVGLTKIIKKVDDTLGYLRMRLKDKKLYDKVNILIVSGHGLTNVTHDDNHTIILDKYLNMSNDVERIPMDGAVACIKPKRDKTEDVIHKLRNNTNITVYKKESIPEKYHYKKHRRIMDILVVANEGFYIVQNSSSNTSKVNTTGQHGYDNRLLSMKPIFMARGPDFKRNYTCKEFETVDIYPLLCHLLGIKPAPNNGNFDKVKKMLSDGSRIRLPSIDLCLCLAGLLFIWHRSSSL